MAHPYDGQRGSAVPVDRGGDRSLQELFAELSAEAAALARQEVELGKIELSRKASQVARDVGFLVMGVAVVFSGLLAIIAAVVVALAHGMPWWVATLLFALVVIGIASFLLWVGLSDLEAQRSSSRVAVETRGELAS